MERQAILERERRWARPAAAAAILAAPLYVVSVALEQGRGLPRTGLTTERYRAVEAAGAEQFAAVVVMGLGFLLLGFALLYLFRATQVRSERVGGAMVGFAFIGPVLLAAQGVIAVIAERRVASEFVAEAAVGGDVYTLLDDLIDDSIGLEIAGSLLIPAVFGLLVAMIYFPLQAMRVGLLTRFFGTLGMAFGATLIFIPPVALLTILLWFVWLGFLFLDRSPRPRPPAWETGTAIPWPRTGEEPGPPQEEELPEDLLQGEGREVGASGEADGLAQRERAKKRKRKRRG